MTAVKLGPNDLQLCETDGARRRHLALAEICPTCEPSIEWSTRCPFCFERVTVVGALIEAHDVEGVESFRCPDSGTVARLPQRRSLPAPSRVLAVAS